MVSSHSLKTILIVDDQPLNVNILGEILRTEYRVTVALNGEQALRLVKSTPQTDLILLDIMMPDIDGFEVCRRLKADASTREIPVIFVTAMTDEVDESMGFKLGAVDYITKPISPPLVQARIRTHLALYDHQRELEAMVNRRTEDLQIAMERLVAERARFEWVVQTAEHGYVILNQEGMISFSNPRAKIYLGLPPDENAGIGEAFIEQVKQRYQLVTQESGENPLVLPYHDLRYLVQPESAAAQEFWLSVDVFEMAEAHQDAQWVVRLHDVSEEIREWKKWGTFTEMVKHKMCTPLTMITSSMQLLRRLGVESITPEMGEVIEVAEHGIERLHQTIKDILAYTDLSRDKEVNEGFEIHNLTRLAKEIASNLGIEQIGVACGGWLSQRKFVLDQRSVEVILWELLENAKKFHPQGSPSVDVLVMPTANGSAQFIVRDNGRTLSPEQLGRLWKPYYQAEKHFSGETPGMGLGLALVASLVWGVGGKCRAYNREDKQGLVIDLLMPLFHD